MSWDISVSKVTGYGPYDWGLITRRNISVSKVTGYGLGDWGLIARRGKYFSHFCHIKTGFAGYLAHPLMTVSMSTFY